MKGKLMMNGTLRVQYAKPTNRTDDRVPRDNQRSDTRPKNRVGPTSGLRGYARVYKLSDGSDNIEVYFMVNDPKGATRNTFSILKYGFGYAYLLATEAYSYLHNLSLLEEMDILGKMPDKDELCSHMAQSLLARGVDIGEVELLEYLN